MTKNNILVIILITCVTSCSKVSVPKFEQSEHLPAGGMTDKGLSDRSFVQVGKNVDRREELDFWTGFSLFRDPWVIAPSSTKDDAPPRRTRQGLAGEQASAEVFAGAADAARG